MAVAQVHLVSNCYIPAHGKEAYPLQLGFSRALATQEKTLPECLNILNSGNFKYQSARILENTE
jgi:hypothetical protein